MQSFDSSPYEEEDRCRVSSSTSKSRGQRQALHKRPSSRYQDVQTLECAYQSLWCILPRNTFSATSRQTVHSIRCLK